MRTSPRRIIVTARARIVTPAVLVLLLVLPVSAEVTPQTHTAKINGIEMYYEVVGEGEPVVLLHGGMQTGRMYDPFVEEFSMHYRLIIPDLRGHGGSTNPSGEFKIRQFAMDVFALLDQLGIDRFSAVGASAGALTVLTMATLQPDRVESMVVIGAGPYLPVECREIVGRWKADTYPETGWDRLRAMHRHGDDQIRALFGFLESLATTYDVAFTPASLSTITARTLILHGDRDYCFPVSMAVEMYTAIPHAYLWIVPNGGHVPIRGEHEARFTEIVLEFLGGAWEQKD
jgi:pimeloyl-ACP methyl ester carboxylesterase